MTNDPAITHHHAGPSGTVRTTLDGAVVVVIAATAFHAELLEGGIDVSIIGRSDFRPIEAAAAWIINPYNRSRGRAGILWMRSMRMASVRLDFDREIAWKRERGRKRRVFMV